MKKDLTTSTIDRANILNNNYAVEKIQDQLGVFGVIFEGKYRFTVKQVAEFYGVGVRTIKRYLAKNEGELRENGYEVLTGERLKQAKTDYLRDINVPKNTPSFGLFDFRSFLNLGMIIVESDRAKEMRQVMLNIVLDTINERTGGSTKYINQRDDDYLSAAIQDTSCKQDFIEALHRYVAMGNVKYAIYTNRIYESIFKENAQEYRKILNLSDHENVEDTMYSEILKIISSFELGIAHEIRSLYKKKGEQLLNASEVDAIFTDYANHPGQKPHLTFARKKMVSRDLHFRDALHEKLVDHLHAIPQEDFERFLGERSKTLEERIEETQDVFKRLKDK